MALFLFASGATEAEAAKSCIATKSLARLQHCDNRVRAMAIRQDELFLLTSEAGPPQKLIAVRAGKPLDTAVTLIPARPGRILASVHAGKDAISVLARDGDTISLLRIPVRKSGGAEVGFTDEYVFHCRNCRSFPALRIHRVIEIPMPPGRTDWDEPANSDAGGPSHD